MSESQTPAPASRPETLTRYRMFAFDKIAAVKDADPSEVTSEFLINADDLWCEASEVEALEAQLQAPNPNRPTLLNAYGRRCFDAGIAAEAKRTVGTVEALEARLRTLEAVELQMQLWLKDHMGIEHLDVVSDVIATWLASLKEDPDE